MLRNLCSSDVSAPTMQTFVRQSSVSARPKICRTRSWQQFQAQCDDARAPSANSATRQLTHHDNWHLPRSFAAANAWFAIVTAVVWPHRDLGHWQDGHALPESNRAYRPKDAFFCRLSSCPHRSPVVPFFRRLDRLAIQDRGTRFNMSSFSLAQFFAQSGVNALPRTVQAPGAKVRIDRFPRRKIMRDGAPLATGAQYIQDGIHNFATRMVRRSPALFGGRH